MQQQQGNSLRLPPSFAQAVGALPASGGVQERAIDLHEASKRLGLAIEYWVQVDGPDFTASAPGPKAAERVRRYAQHLFDRGGLSAPRDLVRSKIPEMMLRLQDVNPVTGAEAEFLTTEEQAQVAALAPGTVRELLSYLPALGRFRTDELELLLLK